MNRCAATKKIGRGISLNWVVDNSALLCELYELPSMSDNHLYQSVLLIAKCRNSHKHILRQIKATQLNIPRVEETLRKLSDKSITFGTLGYFTCLLYDAPEQHWEQYRDAIRKKRKNVYDPKYISMREGITIQEAEEYIANYKKAKCTSREGFISRHGSKAGEERFKEFQISSDSASYTYHLRKCNGDVSQAWDNFHLAGRAGSRRCPEYYILRGHTEDQAVELVSTYQRENSGVHREYYELRGYSSTEITEILSEITLLKCAWLNDKDKKDNADAKCRYTNEESGLWRALADIPLYVRYRNKVVRRSNSRDLTQLANYTLRGAEYHLDHKLSVRECYDNGLSVDIASSIHNLHIIPAHENLAKWRYSYITVAELLDKVRQ